MGRPRSYNPDAFNNNMLWEWASHNLDSEFWRMRSARWDRITVPLYSVGNWTGVGLHLRGNTEGFMWPRPSTRSCASTPAPTSIRSTRRKGAWISCAASTIG